MTREEIIKEIFKKHEDAIFVTATGFISREVYNLYPEKNVFYMQGSMGLAPAIGLGIALSTKKQVVVLNGDGGHLMHLGLTHTIRDAKLENLIIYVLNNNCYESVGQQPCSILEHEYVGVDKIYNMSCDGKPFERVGISFKDNANFIKKELK